MPYHFDGLAATMLFAFSDDTLTITSQPYESNLYKDYDHCVVFESGTGPTWGTEVCLTNPLVNLLPLNGRLWLTIDTRFWGSMAPGTLETTPETVSTTSITLNAHPTCDPASGDCFVQHPW
jgi:hypothetical protein